MCQQWLGTSCVCCACLYSTQVLGHAWFIGSSIESFPFRHHAGTYRRGLQNSGSP